MSRHTILSVVLVASTLFWVGVVLGQRARLEEALGELEISNSHYGYCGAECERYFIDMVACHRGREEVFTLDERREECQRHLIRWSDIPMSCYVWRATPNESSDEGDDAE